MNSLGKEPRVSKEPGRVFLGQERLKTSPPGPPSTFFSDLVVATGQTCGQCGKLLIRGLSTKQDGRRAAGAQLPPNLCPLPGSSYPPRTGSPDTVSHTLCTGTSRRRCRVRCPCPWDRHGYFSTYHSIGRWHLVLNPSPHLWLFSLSSLAQKLSRSRSFRPQHPPPLNT